MEENGKAGKYELRAVIGRGAAGIVYEGWDPVLARKVAIKTLPLAGQDMESREQYTRFQQEAQAAGRLHHPNIVAVFDYGETTSHAFIVMEHLPGGSLKARMERDRRMPIADMLRIMRGLLAGLEHSHAHGVVHRDIKPANVVFGDQNDVKITDFGIARLESSSLTVAGSVLGTPAYMSPEQVLGETADVRSDIYSAGVILYEMLTGQRPFEGAAASIMHKIVNMPPPRPSGLPIEVPQRFDVIIARALAKAPEDRYQSALEFAQALHDEEDLTLPLQRGPASLSTSGTAGSSAQLRPLTRTGTAAGDPSWTGAGRDTGQHAPSPRDPLASRTSDPLATAVGGSRPVAPHPAPAALPQPARSKTPMLLGIAAALAVLVGGAAAWTMFGGSPAIDPRVAMGSGPNGQKPQPPPTPGPQTPGPQTPAAPVPPTPAVPPPPVATAPTPPTPVVPTPLPPSPAPQPQTPPGPPSSATGSQAAPPSRPTEPPAVAAAPLPQTPLVQAPATAPPVAETPPVQPPQVQAAPIQPPAVTATQAGPAIPPATPPAAQPVSADPLAAVRAAVAGPIGGMPCSLIEATFPAPRAVLLTGVTGLGDTSGMMAEAALRGALAQNPAIGTVDSRIRRLDGPFCEVLDTLRPVFDGAAAPGTKMSLALASSAEAMANGGAIRLTAGMPDYPAILRIDRFAADGSVVHLVMPAADAAPAAANASVALAATAGGASGWVMARGEGTSVVVAIASAAPLGLGRRPQREPAVAYLTELDAALKAARGAGRISVGLVLAGTQ